MACHDLIPQEVPSAVCVERQASKTWWRIPPTSISSGFDLVVNGRNDREDGRDVERQKRQQRDRSIFNGRAT